MNTEWRRFLEQSGARISPDLEVSFNDAPLAPEYSAGQGLFTDLSWLAPVEVSGKDALEFLNGQFTSDIRHLPAATTQFSAWCNPQGRVIALFIVYHMEQGFYLLIPAALKELFLKRLGMYVLRSEVVISDRSRELTCLGIIGDKPVPGLATAPETPGGVSRQGELTLLRIGNGSPGRLLVTGPVPAMQSLWHSLQTQLTPARSSLWRHLDIANAIPWIHENTSGLFLPQELNLDITGGLSYDKGCYPGQEVIARVHYRGRVKRRLHRSLVPADSSPPDRGAKLYADDANDSSGCILNVADSGAGEYAVLAVVDTEQAAAGTLHIGDKSGPAVAFAAVPEQTGAG